MYQWGLSVVTASVALGIAELMLPNLNIAKFAKIAFGLILLLVITKPLVNIMLDDFKVTEKYQEFSDELNDKVEKYQTQTNDSQGESLYIFDNEMNIDKVVDELKQKLANHVISLGESVGVTVLEAETEIFEEGNKQFGTVLEVNFTYNESDDGKVNDLIKLISEDFRLDKNFIKAEAR